MSNSLSTQWVLWEKKNGVPGTLVSWCGYLWEGRSAGVGGGDHNSGIGGQGSRREGGGVGEKEEGDVRPTGSSGGARS